MTPFAIGDEHTSFAGVDVAQRQTQDLATAKTAQHHRLDHRSIPPRSQRRHQRVDLTGIQDPRQSPRRADQRHPPPPVRSSPKTLRDRVLRHGLNRSQILEQARHARNPAPDRASRQARLAIFETDNIVTPDRTSLRLDKPQHISGRHLARVLGHNREEHLQIECHRKQRVKPSPRPHEPQIRIDNVMTQPDRQHPRHLGTLHTRHPRQRHNKLLPPEPTASITATTRRWITRISSPSGCRSRDGDPLSVGHCPEGRVVLTQTRTIPPPQLPRPGDRPAGHLRLDQSIQHPATPLHPRIHPTHRIG